MAGLAGVLGFHTKSTTSSIVAAPPRSSTSGRSGSGGRPASATQMPKPAVRATANGSNEQYGYGQLSVRVTVSGNRITNVSVPNIQTVDPTSQQIATQVIPMLRSEVLSAQSARIQGVSGATYTSEAYAVSLQSALGKLHFK
ncbi:MAG: FMN-binding protein [Acidimicrobiales bacterium]